MWGKPNLKWALENGQGLGGRQKAGRRGREYSSNRKQGGGTKPTANGVAMMEMEGSCLYSMWDGYYRPDHRGS